MTYETIQCVPYSFNPLQRQFKRFTPFETRRIHMALSKVSLYLYMDLHLIQLFSRRIHQFLDFIHSSAVDASVLHWTGLPWESIQGIHSIRIFRSKNHSTRPCVKSIICLAFLVFWACSCLTTLIKVKKAGREQSNPGLGLGYSL